MVHKALAVLEEFYLFIGHKSSSLYLIELDKPKLIKNASIAKILKWYHYFSKTFSSPYFRDFSRMYEFTTYRKNLPKYFSPTIYCNNYR
jgi:hypothetical protein